MIIGAVSDTHNIDDKILKAVIAELAKRGAEYFIHCGDIEPQHVDADLFLNKPVVCALNAEQVEKPAFKNPPPGWIFTTPDQRVIDINHIRTYVGHKRSFDFLLGSERRLLNFMETIRNEHDGLRCVFSGHTHHQIGLQTPHVDFFNPGAVYNSFDGYEFAVIDTSIRQVVFSRLMKTPPVMPTFSIGIISDSLRISQFDPKFWEMLTKELSSRDAGTVIHCGNIATEDIGRPELANFCVYCNLRPGQINKAKSMPPNWHLIDPAYPVVEINGYRFYVQLDLGMDLLEESEVGMHKICLNLRRQFNELDFVLCGFTRHFLFEEGEQICIVNPGDVVQDRNFAVICMPRKEVTFGHVPRDETLW